MKLRAGRVWNVEVTAAAGVHVRLSTFAQKKLLLVSPGKKAANQRSNS